MDKISDQQKLEWLTTTVATRERVMIDRDHLRVPNYKMARLRRQIHQPSLGSLGKIPSELLCMVFTHLTCDDLEALYSCSTGGCISVLAFPQYRDLLKHAPTILAILKETRLARSFTIKQIYETFVSSLCTNCGQFGGYVFLPSFTRCCRHCAETDLKFCPIDSFRADFEFGIQEEDILKSLPKLKSIPGNYSGFNGEKQHRNQKFPLFSRELVEKFRDPNHVAERVYCQSYVGETSIQEHKRYMALTALPCFLPKSDSVEKGVYCVGCDTRAKEHRPCLGKDLSEYLELVKTKVPNRYVTDGFDTFCDPKGPCDECILVTEQDRLHDSRQVLSHLQSCGAAQNVLKMKWILSRKKVSGKNS